MLFDVLYETDWHYFASLCLETVRDIFKSLKFPFEDLINLVPLSSVHLSHHLLIHRFIRPFVRSFIHSIIWYLVQPATSTKWKHKQLLICHLSFIQVTVSCQPKQFCHNWDTISIIMINKDEDKLVKHQRRRRRQQQQQQRQRHS